MGARRSIHLLMFYLVMLILYTVVSFEIFHKINKLPGLIVDEIFHVPQGIQFCKGNFSYYDPKITTPPGLYLISSIILGPLKLCNLYWLRIVNFASGLVNIELIRQLVVKSNKERNVNIQSSFYRQICDVMSAFNIALLPPLYFFNNLYYTDTIATTSVLLMMVAAKKERHEFAILFAFLSLTMRQTNIIWICLVFGEYLSTILLQVSLGTAQRRLRKTMFTASDVLEALLRIYRRRMPLRNITLIECFYTFLYVSLIQLFFALVFKNGGFVLGDKDAHQLCLHVPQVFYFGIFCSVFSLPHLVNEVKSFVNRVKQNLLIFVCVVASMTYVVYANTEVHPYLLADNRHYTFYIWNRFFGRYFLVKYLSVPVYGFIMYALCKKLIESTSVTFHSVFFVGTTFVLIFQKLIDVRYFLIPYIIYRSRLNVYSKIALLVETLISITISILTLNVYFKKEFFWDDFQDTQRIIW